MENLKLQGNLRYLMRLHGNLRVNDLARLTKLKQPTLHHIVTGKTKNPRRDSLERLAEFFNVSVNQLLGIEALPKMVPIDVQTQLDIRYVPVVSWSEMVKWPGNKIPRYQVNESRRERQIIADVSINKNAFAVTMEEFLKPIFLKDAVVIFDPETPTAHNDYILVYVDQLDQVQLVRLQVQDSKRYIKCRHNKKGELLPLDPYKDKVIARVVETRIRFEGMEQ